MPIEADATGVRLGGVALLCPRDRTPLQADGAALVCPTCGTGYPLVGGVPVLINDANSVFAIADYVTSKGYEGAGYASPQQGVGALRRLYRRTVNALGESPSGLRRPDAHDALAYVRAIVPRPLVLVVGAGSVRLGGPEDRVLYTDVAFGPLAQAIVDCHDLPFPDGSFDLVVASAVLEHVADPQRAVAEMTRVLKPKGHAYAVTPFLQPVHMDAYDFTRFTPIGHRRLFRDFDEVAAGVALGMGSVMAWTLRSFLESLSANRTWRTLAHLTGLLVAAPLRLLDRWTAHGEDAAGGYWFLGRRRAGGPVSDRELVNTYRAQFAARRQRLPAPPTS